jgi:hypothetical protein
MPPRQPRHDDPESVYTAFLAADIRPVIRAARPDALLAAHDAVARHLRRYLTGDCSRPGGAGGDSPCLQPAFRLYWHAEKAASASLLLAVSTTSYASGPASPADPPQLRRALLNLADSIDALLRDADKAAVALTADDLPDDVHAIGLAVISAARLHRHAARAQAVHLLYCLWQHLQPAPGFAATLPFPAPGYDAIPLN